MLADCLRCYNDMHFLQQDLLCAYMGILHSHYEYIQAPFRITVPNQDMEDKSMSAVRISVEWLFGDIASTYKFIDYKKNLKMELSSVGKMYIVAAILRNALKCLYGNSTSSFFYLSPPSLQEYFS